MEDKKVLLSIKDLKVKFHVRGRILTAIRGISLDIYEGESIAIVGESGSGKSVFTKTFAGMLDSNGFVSDGSIIFNDDELADTVVPLNSSAKSLMDRCKAKLDEAAKLSLGSDTYRLMQELKSEKTHREGLSDEEEAKITAELENIKHERVELFNLRQTFDPNSEKDKIKESKLKLKELDAQIKEMEKRNEELRKQKKAEAAADTAYLKEYSEKMADLKAKYEEEIKGSVDEKILAHNEILAKEIYLSVGRYGVRERNKYARDLVKDLAEGYKLGLDMTDDQVLNSIFDDVTFRVKYQDETADKLHGTCILNLAKVKYYKDWSQIRGKKIATVFQDPMTSLNPVITIGKQITSVILKHQDCTESEARLRALELMRKVGIPNAEKRFDDYPFQYSGGMRQRIVIAIALSCQPKILICDEPTTALDVTIQAQILKLIKDLQKDFGYTIVFITHDLGVVANVADRVAVLYAGQIVELGTCEDVFYDPKHPYTWALLSSLPQLAEKNTKLFSITGTPPSLYNNIVGDAFAPRNEYCMKIDTILEPPMFKVSDTHYAKTWLLDKNAPEIKKPEIIENIHEKLINAFNI
ncbi:MAG: ATP-binding cassette domain-containing protein [Lachnospiraceae bacterium]|nr:ATP-binding cassette domain-containing protein [Lachnospiraceae bacterium]